MNHFFTLQSSKGVQVFLPIDSVLKGDGNLPITTNARNHPYSTRSKDTHNVANSNPETTIHVIQQCSKQEGQSETQFMSEQLNRHEKIELEKQQEEAAKKQERQNRIPGKDFDVDKVNVDEQKRLYEKAQRASKQGGGEGQSQVKSNVDGNIAGSQQRGGRQHQPLGNYQGSSVDPTGHLHHMEQQQFYGSPATQYQNQQPNHHQGSDIGYSGIGQQQFDDLQVPQHQTQQPGYQSSNVDNAGYRYNMGQQQFQVPQHQRQQPGYQDPNLDHTGYRHKDQQQFHGLQGPQHRSQQPYYDTSHTPSHSACQPTHPQPDPAAQMAHIPRAGEGSNFPLYNPSTGVRYNDGGTSNHGLHRQVSHHQYEPIPGPVEQRDPYSQHHQQYPASQSNPFNLEEGSMILYGDPPLSGIIKWLGYLPEVEVYSAGIELVII